MGDTRQEILDTALELFADQGYDKTSLREIAEQVGVTKAALYYHFRSKEDILVALVEPIMVDADSRSWRRCAAVLCMTPPPGRHRSRGCSTRSLDNRRIFALMERNGHTLLELAHQGDFAETHLELHRRTEEFFADETIPLARRVRLACAFGAVTGVLEVGGTSPFGGVPDDELRTMVRAVISRRPRTCHRARHRVRAAADPTGSLATVHADRLARVRAAMAEQHVDACLLSVGPDLPWLIGYEAMPLERLTMLVVPRDGVATLVVPTLEVPRVVERDDDLPDPCRGARPRTRWPSWPSCWARPAPRPSATAPGPSSWSRSSGPARPPRSRTRRDDRSARCAR